MASNKINNTEIAIKLLAKAILELAKKSAREWNYDGEQIVVTGISLEDETEIEEIAK